MLRIPDPRADRIGATPGASNPLAFAKVGPVAAFLLLGVVVLAVFVLGRVGSDGAAPAAPENPDAMTREPRIEVLDDGALAAQYPATVRDELQDEIFAWFQETGRQALSDRSEEDEEEWVRWFLSDAVRPRLERLPLWVFGSLADPARVADEPGPHRGKLVQVWGAVRSIEQVELPTAARTRAWRLAVDDPAGIAWSLLTVREPSDATRPGSWVKGCGAFVKMRPSPEGKPTYLVFSAQRPAPSYPPVAYTEISPEWAADVHDDTIEASQRRPGDEDSFYRLLNYVRTLGPDGYRAKVASGELKVTDMSSSRGATDLAQKPALHRFELVRLRVGIARGAGAFVTEPDLPENPGNIRDVFRGFVLDDQGRTVWVISPFPAETYTFGSARLALVEGFFYKRKAVEQKDGKLYWMPVIVATSITPIDVSKSETHFAVYAAWIALVGVAACVVLWAVLLVRGRRAAAETRRRQAERVARRAGGKAADGAEGGA